MKEKKMTDEKMSTSPVGIPGSSNAASNNATSNNAASNNAASNNATSNNATPNNATPNNATPNNAASNNATPNNATSNNAASNTAASNNATSNNAASNNATSNNTTPNNATSNNATPNNATPNNAASNNAASNNAASNNPASHSAASNNATANNRSSMTSNTTSLQAGDGAGFYTSVVPCNKSSPIFDTPTTGSIMAGEGLHRSNSESKNDGSRNDEVDGLTPGEQLDRRLLPLTVGSQIPGISIRPRRTSISEGTPVVSVGDIPETPESINETHRTIFEMSGMGCKGPENPKFVEFSARQRTFQTWDADQSVKHNLAHAGFFYAGYFDCVRCFYCNGLRHWRRQDNPLIEHARSFPSCRYIQHFVGPDFISAVRVLEKNNNNITLKIVAKYMRSMGQPLGSWFDGLMKTDMAAIQPLIDEGYDPETVKGTAISLRRNGVIPSADIILRKLKEDDSPAGASARYTPNSAHEQTFSILQRENDFLRKRITCIRCNFKEVGIIFLPCGHLITCPECSFTCSRCPLCDESILGKVRSYI